MSVELLARWRKQGIGPPYSKLSRKLILYAVADLDALVESRRSAAGLGVVPSRSDFNAA
jgi:hypothetical protein